MNQIELLISQSEESNDHQVRFRIDGHDWLGGELGIDPPEFFRQKNLYSNGELLVGRCECGVVGCGDIFVDVEFENETVRWKTSSSKTFLFNRLDFISEIQRAKDDFSWEDTNRRAERLVSGLLGDSILKPDMSFDWASCRIETNTVTLSFSRKSPPEDFEQRILKFRWNGKDPNNALAQAKEFLNKQKNAIQQSV